MVLIDVLAKTEGGVVFLDTKAAGSPLAYEVGTTNKFIPEGLNQVHYWYPLSSCGFNTALNNGNRLCR